MFTRLPIILLAAFLSGRLACAQEQAVVSVVKDAAAKQTVSLGDVRASGPQGQAFLKTLQRNLQLSGYFTLAQSGSVRISGSVRETAPGQATVACTIDAPAKRFRYSQSGDAERAARGLADALVEQLTGKKGMASSQIAVILHRSPDNADLYTMYADGYGLRQLTRTARAAVGPRWTPDGSSLYFTSYKRDFPAAYRVGADGSGLRQLIRFNGLSTGATLAPNGALVALILSYNGNPELCTLDPFAARVKRLTKTKYAAEASPCWSPDGRQIVYVSDASKSPQLYICELASGKIRRLTYRGSESVNPCWGANGLICFATRRGGGYQVATIDPRIGEASVKLVGEGESPSWAADGRHIICSRKEGRKSAVWQLDTQGDPPVRLTRHQGNWICPSASR